MSSDEEIVQWLKQSREQVGEKDPVVMSSNGEVINGKHRLKAYPGWKTVTIDVDSEEKIIERIHRNIHRVVPKSERKSQIAELAYILEHKGVKPENMLHELKKRLPFHEDYIRKLMPRKYKRKYKERPKPQVKTLYPGKPSLTIPPSPTEPLTKLKKEKTYLCPVCGAMLKIQGDLLVEA
jgi:hypothetical protein